MRFLKHAFVFAAFLLTSPLLAAEGSWSLLGPDGGNVQSLALDPGDLKTVYAGIRGGEGVFKSTDGGATWRRSGAGLPKGSDAAVRALAVDPRRRTTLYAGTASQGVYKSTDGGETWSPRSQGMVGTGATSILSLAIDPRPSGAVFAGTFFGVFKSTDGGAHWQHETAGLPDSPAIRALAIDPRRPNTVYALNDGDVVVYRSTDGGETWSPSGTGIIAGQGGSTLAIDPLHSLTLYAATYGIPYKSTDGGRSWLPIRDGLPEVTTILSLLVDPRKPRRLFLGTAEQGIFRSDDAGASWVPANAGLSNLRVQTLAAGGKAVYAGTAGGDRAGEGGPGGVFQSADGQVWQRTVRGLVASRVTTLTVEGGSPDVLWAGTENLGLFRSANAGGVWRRVPIPGVNRQIFSIAADSGHPGTAYVTASKVTGIDFSIDVYKTADAGRTWSRLSPRLSNPASLRLDPRTGVLWLFGSGLQRSADGGRTWTVPAGIAPGDYLLDLAFDPASPNTLYAGGFLPPPSRFSPSEARLYKSTDGGATWTRSDTGLAGEGQIGRIAVSPDAPSTVYAAAGGNLYRSVDAGGHWNQVATAPEFGGITGLVAAPGALYAGTSNTGVYTSRDGTAWTPINQGLASLAITDLALSPGDPDTLYAATENGGVEVRTGLSQP